MGTHQENKVNSEKLQDGQLRAKLDELWETDLTLGQIRSIVRLRTKTVMDYYESRYGTEAYKARKSKRYSQSKTGELNPMTGKSNSEHHNWQGGSDDLKGYLTISTPEWYESEAKRIFTHHAVWAMWHGYNRVPKGYVIHHIDHNPRNNKPENLQLLTPSAHLKLHRQESVTTR